MNKRFSANIPTDAEFAAASEKMARRIQREGELKRSIVAACACSPVFHDAYVWLSLDFCRIDLFVRLDSDIGSASAASLKDKVLTLVAALEPSRDVAVEVDSHERVLREFGGDYLKLFR